MKENKHPQYANPIKLNRRQMFMVNELFERNRKFYRDNADWSADVIGSISDNDYCQIVAAGQIAYAEVWKHIGSYMRVLVASDRQEESDLKFERWEGR